MSKNKVFSDKLSVDVLTDEYSKFRSKHHTIRFGQYICNLYAEKAAVDVYYEEDPSKAYNLIYSYISKD